MHDIQRIGTSDTPVRYEECPVDLSLASTRDLQRELASREDVVTYVVDHGSTADISFDHRLFSGVYETGVRVNGPAIITVSID